MADDHNPLGLEADDWQPSERSQPADDDVVDRYEQPEPELFEWTPERAGAVVRAAGYALHTADGLSREPEGTELWRATERDVQSMGAPLARILNRYAPARRLAGVVDEGEFAVAMLAYARHNLAERGRVATAKKRRDEQTEQAAGDAWPATAPPLGDS